MSARRRRRSAPASPACRRRAAARPRAARASLGSGDRAGPRHSQSRGRASRTRDLLTYQVTSSVPSAKKAPGAVEVVERRGPATAAARAWHGRGTPRRPASPLPARSAAAADSRSGSASGDWSRQDTTTTWALGMNVTPPPSSVSAKNDVGPVEHLERRLRARADTSARAYRCRSPASDDAFGQHDFRGHLGGDSPVAHRALSGAGGRKLRTAAHARQVGISRGSPRRPAARSGGSDRGSRPPRPARPARRRAARATSSNTGPGTPVSASRSVAIPTSLSSSARRKVRGQAAGEHALRAPAPRSRTSVRSTR